MIIRVGGIREALTVMALPIPAALAHERLSAAVVDPTDP